MSPLKVHPILFFLNMHL